ncbi:MAG: carboxymuconolactone decarboxylase family protein, partial [Planctomycetota bacterium]
QTVAARRGVIEGDAKLEAVTRLATALHEKRGFVSDEDVEKFKSAGFSDGAVAEAVAVYAFATFTNFFNHVNETEVDFPAAPSI